MTTRTLSETLAPQLAQLTRLAQMVDERGFYISLTGPNDFRSRQYSTIMDSRQFVYFQGGMLAFIKEWVKLTGRATPVGIRVHEPRPDGKFDFYFDVPNRVKYKPIIAALDLFSQERKGRRHGTEYQGTGFLKCSKLVDRYDYAGEGKAALEAVVRVLEMEHHRKILTSVKSGGE